MQAELAQLPGQDPESQVAIAPRSSGQTVKPRPSLEEREKSTAVMSGVGSQV